MAMCQQILQQSSADPAWLPNLWTSDEANFNLNGITKLTQRLFIYLSFQDW
jgi:hypothetical protein